MGAKFKRGAMFGVRSPLAPLQTILHTDVNERYVAGNCENPLISQSRQEDFQTRGWPANLRTMFP